MLLYIYFSSKSFFIIFISFFGKLLHFRNRILIGDNIVTKNGKIVWTHGPNWQFYALMLRTKLSYNPFFFTGHQNVNKRKSRAARTDYGLIFLPFYKTNVSFFSFLCQDAYKARLNCAIIGGNLSRKH